MSRRTLVTKSSLRVFVGAAGPALFLTGCPLSDDYFVNDLKSGEAASFAGVSGGGTNPSIDSTDGGTQTVSVGGTSAGQAGDGSPGGDPSTGAGGSATGGTQAVGGAAAQAGQPTGGAPVQNACDVPCNAGRACNGDECQSGWVLMANPSGFPAREGAAYTSIGDRLFVWGGLSESGSALNSGALYDPVTDSWELAANDEHTPTPRFYATAVWTGTVVIVAGGMASLDSEPLDDGAIYDPDENAWRPLDTGMRPRIAPVGAATDDLALFWGGYSELYTPRSGLDVYDLARDRWMNITDDSEDPGALLHSAWAGGELTFWVYGGMDDNGDATDRVAYYSMNNEHWNAFDNAPSARWGGFGAFLNVQFYVWGGRNDNENLDSGFSYRLSASEWDVMEQDGAPSARYAAHRESGWSFEVDDELIVVIGGLESEGAYLRDGGVYDTGRDEWDSIEPWRSGEEHAFGAAGWVAGELVVWGGRDGSSLSSSGDRWRPAN